MKFRNTLAASLAIGVIPIIWILQGLGLIGLAGEIIGATISIETTIVYFYFRKKPEAEK